MVRMRQHDLYWPVPEVSQSLLTKAFLFSSKNWLGMRPAAPPTTLRAYVEIRVVERCWEMNISHRKRMTCLVNCHKQSSSSLAASCSCLFAHHRWAKCTYSPATSWGPPCSPLGGCLPWKRPSLPPYRGSGCLWSDYSWSVALDKPTI